jgi:thiamine-monophosphate kinase
MMDLSDGLPTDLSHNCAASEVGARVTAAQLPGHNRLAVPAELLKQNQLAWMVAGGEDYELLFTADPANRKDLLRLTEGCHDHKRIQPVGTIVEGKDVTLIRKTEKTGQDNAENISFQGFDHFPV